MTDHPSEQEDVAERLRALEQAKSAAADTCQFRTAVNAGQETRRLARREHLLIPYLQGTFTVMNYSLELLDPAQQRDMALELISLLEDDARARQFQPDLPEDEYEEYRFWMTACSYDNFAAGTAHLQGYNSPGMHACINDGIQVCRRTGKTQCIKCFREYATEVYKAADDIPMALHFARLGMAHEDPGPHDRRWVGAKDEADLLLLQGNLVGAIEAVGRAWQCRSTYHSPLQAERITIQIARQLALLTNRTDDVRSILPGSEEPPRLAPLSPGECPLQEIQLARLEALASLLNGHHELGLKLLEDVDGRLQKRQCLDLWFAARSQWLASLKWLGATDRFERHAQPLERAAKKAEDWRTLRLLSRLRMTDRTSHPWAFLEPVVTSLSSPVLSRELGSTAPESPQLEAVESPAGRATTTDSEEVGTAEPAVESPLDVRLREIMEQLFAARRAAMAAAEQEAAKGETPLEGGTPPQSANTSQTAQEAIASVSAQALREILQFPESMITSAGALGRCFSVLRWTWHEGMPLADIWRWGVRVARPYQRDGELVSQQAALGDWLLAEAADPTSLEGVGLMPSTLTALHRSAIDLHGQDTRVLTRAGNHYLGQGNENEAERCFARACRLDRTNSQAALRLADIYSRSDRRRDALAVLDLCLREGSQEAEVAWQAALIANSASQYGSVPAYLDRFDALEPEAPWSHHYRAAALLELDQPQAALAAIDIESQRNPTANYAHAVQRASALGASDRWDECRAIVRDVLLTTPLTTVDYLTISGLARLHRRLWLTMAKLPADDLDRRSHEQFLLATGLAPDDWFLGLRTQSGAPEQPGVHFYRCILRQPLPEDWGTSVVCRAGEESWRSYAVHWGVLATDQDSATDLALAWQGRCHPTPPEVISVEEEPREYRDHPGILWQGFREESESP